MPENLKIIFNKIYIDDEHAATIWFNELIVKIQLAKTALRSLDYILDKLNLKLNVEYIK